MISLTVGRFVWSIVLLAETPLSAGTRWKAVGDAGIVAAANQTDGVYSLPASAVYSIHRAVVEIPEPATITLLGGGLLLLMILEVRRRRG
jgi:hypothetical protein